MEKSDLVILEHGLVIKNKKSKFLSIFEKFYKICQINGGAKAGNNYSNLISCTV
jgi:hypothetical protein